MDAKKRVQEKAEQNKAAEIFKKKSIKSFKIWYTSEKKSKVYLRQLKKISKNIKKEYKIKLNRILVFQPPGVVLFKDAITAYYFKNITDLNKFEQIAAELKTANLYFRDIDSLVLYYSGK